MILCIKIIFKLINLYCFNHYYLSLEIIFTQENIGYRVKNLCMYKNYILIKTLSERIKLYFLYILIYYSISNVF